MILTHIIIMFASYDSQVAKKNIIILAGCLEDFQVHEDINSITSYNRLVHLLI